MKNNVCRLILVVVIALDLLVISNAIIKLNDENKKLKEKDKEINRLNNIIDETTKYVKSLSSSGRGCDIYDDIKKEILNELKGDNK